MVEKLGQGGCGVQRWWSRARWWQRLAVVLLVLVVLGLITALVLLIIVLARAGAARPTPSLGLLGGVITPGVEDGQELLRAHRLAQALSIPTVSFDVDHQNVSALLEMHTFLFQNYPLVHSSAHVEVQVVNSLSLLYAVRGSSPGEALPYLLTAHLDVVPANPATWSRPPFEGQVVNNTYIYGRGAIDNKNGVLGILEALEYLLSQGKQPLRSFYIGFGHDEEILGTGGAQEIARELRRRGVEQLDFVLDEGLVVTKDILPGAGDTPVAMVGVSEKGWLTLELSATGAWGHSSLPPLHTTIGTVARAAVRVEENLLPSQLGRGIERHTLEQLAPHVDFGTRMLYMNQWLFASLLTAKFETDPLMNALIRTTTALTIFQAGVKENVVPGEARALVNFRVHPSQSTAEVETHVRRVVADPSVQVRRLEAREAHPVSPFDSEAVHYQLIAATIEQTFQQVVVVPSFLVANTDTHWYLNFSRHVFRFCPSLQGPADVVRLHGNDERISVSNWAQTVSFYHRLMLNADLIAHKDSKTL